MFACGFADPAALAPGAAPHDPGHRLCRTKGRHLGLGGSGLASASALLAGGADVIGWDDNAEFVVKATSAGIPTADLREVDWSRVAALVLAPGVPLTHPAPHWSAALAQPAGVEVIGDIELFCRQRRLIAPTAPLVAITGTNGKSTTTALTSHLLRSAGHDAQMGGNIGTAILSLEPLDEGRAYVIECSSYQIDLAPTLDPSVGILLNLTEDHIDRHGTLQHYAAVKERLVAGVPPDGTAIVGVDDEWCVAAADRMQQAGKRLLRVSVRRALPDGLYLDGETIMQAAGGSARAVARIGNIGSLRGVHNAQNAACAAGAALALGLSLDAIQQGLESFPGLAHRMEQVGARAVSCSSTIPRPPMPIPPPRRWPASRHFLDRGRQAEDRRHRLAGALFSAHSQGLPDRRGGGRLRGRARRAGPPRDRGHAAIGRWSLPRTMPKRSGLDQPVVLLSPACASFDQYRNFEIRGDKFRDLVLALPDLVPMSSSS